MKIIGNKNEFAVEYEITDPEKMIGYSKIWFGGNFIGTSEDLIYLKSYLFSGLQKIGNAKHLSLRKQLDTDKMFNMLNDRLDDFEDQEIHNYLVTFGTFCDDFTIFCFLVKNEINIIWKLNFNKTPFSDLNNQDSQLIRQFKINKESFLETLSIVEGKILTT